MEYEIIVKTPSGVPIFPLYSNERRHARALRELAAIPGNDIAVEVMRTARRPVRFAGLDAPAPTAPSATTATTAPVKPAVKSVK